MKDEDRRSILRHLTNEQYDDIIRVSSSYPLINMDVKVKGNLYNIFEKNFNLFLININLSI